VLVGALVGVVGAALRRWRRWYPVVVGLFVAVFGAALAVVVQSWR